MTEAEDAEPAGIVCGPGCEIDDEGDAAGEKATGKEEEGDGGEVNGGGGGGGGGGGEGGDGREGGSGAAGGEC